MENSLTIIAGTALFFVVAILLVVVLLVAKKYLVPSGNVKITINEKDTVETPCLLSSRTLAGPVFAPERKLDYHSVAISGFVR